MFAQSSTLTPSAVFVSLPTNWARAAFSSKYATRFCSYSAWSFSSGLIYVWPSEPSKTTLSPLEIFSVIPGILSTAGISRARARIAEWEVLPPTSVRIPVTFLGLIPAVIDGVKSSATRTVPSGTFARSTSSTSRSIFNNLVFISHTSVALCWNISSSIEENICI